MLYNTPATQGTDYLDKPVQRVPVQEGGQDERHHVDVSMKKSNTVM